MNEQRKKPPSAGASKDRLPESQEPDAGRGAPQPATSDDQARADQIVRNQRPHGSEGNE